MTNPVEGYQILEQPYSGTNTIVYRAVREADHLPVILKVVAGDCPTADQLGRYRHEFEIINIIKSNNIIGVVDLAQNQSLCSLVLEDCGGQSLAQLKKDGYDFNIPEFLSVAIKIVEGISQIHAASVIHKDINPSNIIYNPKTGDLKIIDFGVSSILPNEQTDIGSPTLLQGTLAYIAPEQTGRMNRSVDYRADFYSLGITLYELLVGNPPFQSEKPLEIIHGHIAGQVPPPHELDGKIPQAISDIVMKLVAKTAEDRYQGSWGIKADLNKCLEQYNQKQPIAIFPLGEHDLPDRFEIPQKLYGRLNEVQKILSLFDSVSAGKSQCLLIAGYSGIGKTSLVREVYKPLTRERGYFVSGKFDQFQKDKPFSAFSIAFSQLVTQILSEGQKSIDQWKQDIVANLGDNIAVLAELIPDIKHITGDRSVASLVESEYIQSRFQITIQKFIKIFGHKGIPLVIFLDDLQWADSASLSLMQLILSDEAIESLLLIGAYRDNEVGESHALTHLVDELKEDNIAIQELTLKQLPDGEVKNLISDALYRSADEVDELARLISDKTGGNPFFIEQLLKNLYSDKLIFFDRVRGTWDWNFEKIRLADIGDNVVDLISCKIRIFPQQTQEVLFVGACVGNVFSLNVLSKIIESTPKEIETILRTLSVSGLLIPIGDSINLEMPNEELEKRMAQGERIEFRFSHDRIQQSSYNIFSEQKRIQMNYRLGWFCHNHDPRDLEEKVFDIVNHLNSAISLIKSKAEKKTLIELNYQSLEKARRSGSYQTAYEYGEMALRLTDAKWTNEQYEIKVKIHTHLAELCALLGRVAEMDTHVDTVLEHGHSVLDKVHILEHRFQYYSARREHSKALDIGISMLAMLGIRIPKHPSPMRVIYELISFSVVTEKKLKKIDFKKLPVLTSDKYITVLRIFSNMATSAFMHSKYLSVLLGLGAAKFSVKYGFCEQSVLGFSTCAVVFGGILERFEKGREYSEMAVDIAAQCDGGSNLPRAIFVKNYFIEHWFKPLSETIAPVHKSYRDSIQAGAFQSATTYYLCNLMTDTIIGRNLSSVNSNCEKAFLILKEIKLEEVSDRIFYIQQFIENLTTLKETPDKLDGRYYTEGEAFCEIEKNDDSSSLLAIYLYKLMLATIYGLAKPNQEIIFKLDQYIALARGIPFTLAYHFFVPLACFLCIDTIGVKAQRVLIKRIKKHLKKLRKYNSYCEANCSHKLALVQAELAAYSGDYENACRLYTTACDLALENKIIFEKALCEEFSGRFYLRQGQRAIACLYLKQAYHSYQKWGATGKLEQLQHSYEDLFGEYSTHVDIDHSITHTNTILGALNSTMMVDKHGLDLDSICQAYEVISGEINLDNLIDSIMSLVIENAGAEKAYLILLENDSDWKVVGFSSVNDEIRTLPAPLQKIHDLPKSIIQFVANSGENIVLKNIQKNADFSHDPYVFESDVKSALCIALKKKNEIRGLLYAENCKLEGAFTRERVRIIDIIAAQGAVAIDNAKLYSSLRESEDQYRGVFENSVEGIFQTNLNNEIILANPAFIEILGYRDFPELVEELCHFGEELYVDTNDSARVHSMLSKDHKVANYETQFYKKDGSVIEVLLSIQLVFDDKNNPIRFDGMLKDVTDQKRSAELIMEKERIEAVANAKSEFLASMSHEIRTPMNGVIGIADILKDTGLSSVQRHYVDVISDSGNALVNIINDILDFSKIESGKMDLESIRFDLVGLLGKCVALFSTKSSEKRLALVNSISPEVPRFVIGDPTRIRQIVLNLLANAFKFTEQGSVILRVDVSEVDRKKWLRFSIVDSGIGISEAGQKSLFQSYVQAESSTTRKFGGTGLGLSISKKLVELMDGEIGVISQLGFGSEFWFQIPLESKDEKDKAVISFSGRKENIVFYSDSIELLKVLQEEFGLDANSIKFFSDLQLFQSELENAVEKEQAVSFFCHSLGQAELLWDRFVGWSKYCEKESDIKLIYLTEPAYKIDFQWLDKQDPRRIFAVERPLSAYQFLQVCISLLEGQSEASSADPTGKDCAQNLSHLKILVAEDNKVNQMVVNTMLEKLKIRASLVDNGEEAVNAYLSSIHSGRSDYDVILMDCEMPVMDGYKASNLIRSRERELDLKPVVIIAATAHALPEFKEKCLANGMNSVITKPILKKDVLQALKQLSLKNPG